jgi:hypothetical protein
MAHATYFSLMIVYLFKSRYHWLKCSTLINFADISYQDNQLEVPLKARVV